MQGLILAALVKFPVLIIYPSTWKFPICIILITTYMIPISHDTLLWMAQMAKFWMAQMAKFWAKRTTLNLVVTISSQTLMGSSLGWGKRECHFVSSVSTAPVSSKWVDVPGSACVKEEQQDTQSIDNQVSTNSSLIIICIYDNGYWRLIILPELAIRLRYSCISVRLCSPCSRAARLLTSSWSKLDQSWEGGRIRWGRVNVWVRQRREKWVGTEGGEGEKEARIGERGGREEGEERKRR